MSLAGFIILMNVSLHIIELLCNVKWLWSNLCKFISHNVIMTLMWLHWSFISLSVSLPSHTLVTAWNIYFESPFPVIGAYWHVLFFVIPFTFKPHGLWLQQAMPSKTSELSGGNRRSADVLWRYLHFSPPGTFAPILNYDEQTKTAHPTQQHMQSIGGQRWPGDSRHNSY